MKYCALLIAGALFTLSCASQPWADMSQTEIQAWKQLGYTSDQARKLRTEKISTAQAEEWAEVGLVGWDAIGPWKERAFLPAQAGDWGQAGFDADQASKWRNKKFTATEAKEWKDGGFSLSKARKARGDGLAPISAPGD